MYGDHVRTLTLRVRAKIADEGKLGMPASNSGNYRGDGVIFLFHLLPSFFFSLWIYSYYDDDESFNSFYTSDNVNLNVLYLRVFFKVY